MINQRRIGFVLSYVSIFVSSVIGILYTPYMISKIGNIEYGLYQLLHAFIGYVALLDFGLGSTLTRFILKYKTENNIPKLQSSISICIKIYSIIAIFIIFVVSILSFNLDSIFSGSIDAKNIDYARKLFVLMGISSAVSIVSHALSGIQTANEKYVFIKSIYIIKHLARVVISVILFQFKASALSIVVTDLLVAIVLLITDILYCRINLKVKLLKGKWDNKLAKSLFSFSFFVFLQIIITQTNSSVDRMLLGMFSTLEVVAMYGVVLQLSNMFSSLSNVVSSVTMPQISKTVFSGADDKEITFCCAKYSRYQLMLSAPLMGGFIILGKMFLKLWMPSFESDSLWICIIIIIIPETLAVVEGTIFHVMKAKNMQKVRSLILFGVMITNIILTILLMKISPLYGPAIGTSVSYIIGNLILSNIYYHKRVGVDMFLFAKLLFKGILPAWCSSLIIGFFISLIPINDWIGFVIKGSLYVLIYLISIYYIGLEKHEKLLLTNLFKTSFNKTKKFVKR